MNLQDLRDSDGKEAIDRLALALGTSRAYLSLLRRGHGRPSYDLAERMVAANPKLKIEDLMRVRT